MDKKVKNRQELLRRCLYHIMHQFEGRHMPSSLRDLVRDITCYVKNPPKMRVRASVDCDRFKIWNAAVAHYPGGDERAKAIQSAIESGAMVQVPLRDLSLMRNKITELSDYCRNLDLEFEE
jgi:hypothetical protein